MFKLKVLFNDGREANFYENSMELIDQRIQTEIVDHPEIYIPGTFTQSVSDVTQELIDQQNKSSLVADRNKKIVFGEELLKNILITSASKNLPDAVVDAFYDSTLFLRIDRMLKSGSIEDAKRNLENNDVSALLTSEEKAAIINKINQFLGV